MRACVLCGAETYNEHHLIPRTVHKNKWFKKHFTWEQLSTTVDVCELCHRAIHDIADNKTLGREYNTLEKLRTHPKIIGHIIWRKKTNAKKEERTRS